MLDYPLDDDGDLLSCIRVDAELPSFSEQLSVALFSMPTDYDWDQESLPGLVVEHNTPCGLPWEAGLPDTPSSICSSIRSSPVPLEAGVDHLGQEGAYAPAHVHDAPCTPPPLVREETLPSCGGNAIHDDDCNVECDKEAKRGGEAKGRGIKKERAKRGGVKEAQPSGKRARRYRGISQRGTRRVNRPLHNHPKHTTAMLKEWFKAHSEAPWPTDEEKKELSTRSGLPLRQVSTWFINHRKRNLKPILEAQGLKMVKPKCSE